MLSGLLIKNYAIIKELNINFGKGFCVITGETGAGKSIIMGALSLILGQRADSSVLNSADEKCVVEGRFEINGKGDIKSFFENNDLDFDDLIILRREILPNGKSRAFINDTPVQLNLLRDIGIQLIDVHSQHSNLELGKKQFQLNVVDWYGGHSNELSKFSELYKEFKKVQSLLVSTKEMAKKSKADLNFYEFQFNQLNEAKLTDGEQEELEQEQEILTHAEDIKSGLYTIFNIIDGEEQSVIIKMKEIYSVAQKMTVYLPAAENILKRIESLLIEARDIAQECEQLLEKTDSDPSRLDFINNRLDLIYTLHQKHRTGSVAELIVLRDSFDEKIQAAASYDEEIERLEKIYTSLQVKMNVSAEILTDCRKKILPEIEKEIISYLNHLGMPNAIFNVEVGRKDDYTPSGIDEVSFLFNANKGGQPEEINKIASGGELSRLMLAIKSVIARSKELPAIIFDEIDTGISGEIANKMADILKSIAGYMQVINITHLPQIASKGDNHYLVYKNENERNVETGMRILDKEERIIEIAKMLSGDNPTPEAIANAKSLLNN
ncbi:MAG: DNA repair protein RecN [Prolixibacteraceae bacterium]|nr:DNA repair protein RecN [Prolixibacteraceae bacterium]